MDLESLKHEIVQSLNIEDFYETYIGVSPRNFQGNGWSAKVLCPIHGDKKTPNLSFNRITGQFKCFSCGAGGSVFDFWLLKNGYSTEDHKRFGEAINEIATMAGVIIDKGDKKEGTKETVKKKVELVIEKKTENHDRENSPIPKVKVDDFISKLNTDLLKFLTQKRGLNKWSIEQFKIGYDDKWEYRDKSQHMKAYGRITIPVFNRDFECRNIRGYTNRCSPEYKMVNYVKNKGELNERKYGSPIRLYNLDRLVKHDWKHVVICEGEFDAILLCQYFNELGMHDWGAVCSTHGAESFEHEFVEWFYGKSVYFLFDADQPGKLAASTICSKFFLNGLREKKFEVVKIVDIPLEGTKEEKDVTDYLVKLKKSFSDLVDLIKESPEVLPISDTVDEVSAKPIEVNSLVDAVLKREYIDKRIKVDIAITGTTSKVYHAVRTYEVARCPLEKDDENACCCENQKMKTLPYGHPIFIMSCMSSEKKILQEISDITCQKDKNPRIKIHEKVVMEQYTASQVVERIQARVKSDEDKLENYQDLINVPVYVLQPKGKKIIEPVKYRTIGYIRTHPQTGVAVYFIESYEKLEEDWSSFNVKDPIVKTALNELKEMSVDEIIKDIVNNVTFIYEAEEILYTVLLTYLCPLGFIFNGSPTKGWLNAAIIGDSGTGKSRTYMRISDWIGAGNLFSALTGSRTGFLYSIKKSAHNQDWNISIGAYVRSNGSIIAIDEMQEMDREDTKRMAISMETGKLAIERVSSATFNTKTRLLMMMNPKNRRGEAATISDFTYGCEALKNCFTPMFIRRLDLAVFTTGNQDHGFYNQKNEVDAFLREGKVKSFMIKSLVYWAWTRKPSDIIWSEESTNECLRISTIMSKKYGYSDTIPLVNPQDFRENLARISVAWAILSTSFSEDMEKVIVQPAHIKQSANFLDLVYSSDACGLDKHSEISKQRGVLNEYDSIKETIEEVVESEINRTASGEGISSFLRLLLCIEKNEAIKKRDLCEMLSVSNQWLRVRLDVLQVLDMIVMNRYGINKTRKFNLFMGKWKSNPDIIEMVNKMNAKIQEDSLIKMKTDKTFNDEVEYDFHRSQEPEVNDFELEDDMGISSFLSGD